MRLKCLDLFCRKKLLNLVISCLFELHSESINLLDASVNTLLVKEDALTRIIQVIRLVESVNAAHVGLEGEGGAIATHTLMLRENVVIDHGTHGHVGSVLNGLHLKGSSLIRFESSSAHLLCGMSLEVSIECGRLSGALEAAATVTDELGHALVFNLDHLFFLWLI